MDEAPNIFSYLPVSFKSEEEQAYIRFLWDAFESNYENGKYQFAFLAFHMLTMSFVYCNIWQIKQNAPKDFEKAMIGFSRDEKDLLKATSPFTFWVINERTIFRFFRLIDCDNGKIGQYVKLVDERNKAAHSNGQIFVNDQILIDRKIAETLRLVDEIQEQSRPLVLACYDRFLESADVETREHLSESDQLREILVHSNYFSRKDIEFCLDYDIGVLAGHEHYDGIRALHEALTAEYAA